MAFLFVCNAWGGSYVLDHHALAAESTRLADASTGGEFGPSPTLTDIDIPGGKYMLGASKKQPWLFDAERYAHLVCKLNPVV